MKTIFCCILLLVTVNAFADTIRCKGGIVSTDDSEVVLLAKCGPPTSVNEFGNIENRGRRSADINRMEAWVYNFGPYEFMYRVILKNGVVKSVENLGPGL